MEFLGVKNMITIKNLIKDYKIILKLKQKST